MASRAGHDRLTTSVTASSFSPLDRSLQSEATTQLLLSSPANKPRDEARRDDAEGRDGAEDDGEEEETEGEDEDEETDEDETDEDEDEDDEFEDVDGEFEDLDGEAGEGRPEETRGVWNPPPLAPAAAPPADLDVSATFEAIQQRSNDVLLALESIAERCEARLDAARAKLRTSVAELQEKVRDWLVSELDAIRRLSGEVDALEQKRRRCDRLVDDLCAHGVPSGCRLGAVQMDHA